MMAEAGQAGTHKPHASQRSTAIAGFSRLQSVSMVMQYFMHFAQQTLSGSKMASFGQIGMHSRQSVHLSTSMIGMADCWTVMAREQGCNCPANVRGCRAILAQGKGLKWHGMQALGGKSPPPKCAGNPGRSTGGEVAFDEYELGKEYLRRFVSTRPVAGP